MGRDKATLEVGGEALWRRQWRTLRAAGIDEIIVTRGSREWAEVPGLIVVPDAKPGCGPLGGLIAGLRRTRAPWSLVLAVDLPLMPPAFLRGLIERAEREGKGVVPVIDGRYEPLAAVYPGACLPLAEEALEGGRWSLQGWVPRCIDEGLLSSTEVDDNERSYFRNVNTPEDLAEIEQLLGDSSKER